MKGLIVKGYWLNFIFQGLKTWEIRGNNCKNIRGTIALIESGSNSIIGTVDIIDSFPLSEKDLLDNVDKHCIKDLRIIKYKKPYAWVLSNPVKFKQALNYRHKPGCVIWVNIEDKSVTI